MHASAWRASQIEEDEGRYRWRRRPGRRAPERNQGARVAQERPAWWSSPHCQGRFTTTRQGAALSRRASGDADPVRAAAQRRGRRRLSRGSAPSSCCRGRRASAASSTRVVREAPACGLRKRRPGSATSPIRKIGLVEEAERRQSFGFGGAPHAREVDVRRDVLLAGVLEPRRRRSTPSDPDAACAACRSSACPAHATTEYSSRASWP